MAEPILVVDDEQAILELCQLVLRSSGYEVMVADNGAKALEMVARYRPAVVVLDYMMPQMDGLKVLHGIRQNYPDSYVIFFTGRGSETVAVDVMKAGAADYLLKPFTSHELLERLERVLHLRRVELINRSLERERSQLQLEIQRWNSELEQRVIKKTQALEQAHREIVQAEKLAMVGQLSAGMAHQIRDPLNSIGLYAQLLATELADRPGLVDYTFSILKAVERVDALLMKLLAASPSPPAEPSRVSLAEAIQCAVDGVLPQIRQQRVTLELDLAANAQPLTADFSEMVQVFSNLFSNALHAMSQGGVLTVVLEDHGEHLYVTVQDNGCGISQHHLSKVFDPFFTTRNKGTGFGLSMVLRSVKACGGTIHIDSQPGCGTTFYLEFPVAAVVASSDEEQGQ